MLSPLAILKGTLQSQFGGRLAAAMPQILTIKSLIAKGAGANSTLLALQKAGLGYRKKVFLSDFAFLSGVKQREGRQKYTRKDRYPDPESYIPEIGSYQDKFRHVIEINLTNKETGATHKGHLSVTTSRRLERKEIEEAADELLEEEKYLSFLDAFTDYTTQLSTCYENVSYH